MGAGANIDADAIAECIGLFFTREGLDVPVPRLVDIVDDPGLFALAGFCGPTSFSNGHVTVRCTRKVSPDR